MTETSKPPQAPQLRYEALVKALGEDTVKSLIARVTQPQPAPTAAAPQAESPQTQVTTRRETSGKTSAPQAKQVKRKSEQQKQPEEATIQAVIAQDKAKTTDAAQPAVKAIPQPTHAKPDQEISPLSYEPTYAGYTQVSLVTSPEPTTPTEATRQPESQTEENQELNDTKTLLQQDPEYIKLLREAKIEFLSHNEFPPSSPEYYEVIFGPRDPNQNTFTLDSNTEDWFKKKFPEKYQELISAERERMYKDPINDPVIKEFLQIVEERTNDRKRKEKKDVKLIQAEEEVYLLRELFRLCPKKMEKYFSPGPFDLNHDGIWGALQSLGKSILDPRIDVSKKVREAMEKAGLLDASASRPDTTSDTESLSSQEAHDKLSSVIDQAGQILKRLLE